MTRSLIGKVEGYARRTPSRVALVSGSDRMTWRDLHGSCRTISQSLGRYNLRQGDRVVLALSNPLEFVPMLLGIWHFGATVVPVRPEIEPSPLDDIFSDCNPAFAVVDSEYLTRRAGRCSRDLLTYSDLAQLGGVKVAYRGCGWQGRRFASIMYTSGTTGKPKGIAHTHAARLKSILALADTFAINESTVNAIVLPLYASATWCMLLPTIYCGGACVFIDHFEPKEFVASIGENDVSIVMLVPAHYEMLIQTEELDSLQRLGVVICTGAFAPMRLKERLQEALGIRFFEAYGATEGNIFTVLNGGMPFEKLGSVGLPIAQVKIKVLVDDLDNSGPPGQAGKIAVSTPGLMHSYYQRPELTKRSMFFDSTIQRMFYRTEDLGQLDSEGFLWLEGRSDDVIVSGGTKILPTDVERVLLDHPDIAMAVVVGMPVEILGETPVAFVVPRAGCEIDSADTCAWANGRLEPHQRLFLVKVVESLPINDMGKVSRQGLLAEFTN